MKLSLIFFVIINVFCIGIESISNGTFVTIKEAPFYVSIIIGNKEFCGGSIISDYWIVSAAHCFLDFENQDVTIRSGSSTDLTFGKKHKIEKVITSEDYNILDFSKTTGTHDISLIKLKKPIIFDEFQQPIKISQDPPKDHDKVIIYGLGIQGPTRTDPFVLKMVEIDIIAQEVCSTNMASLTYVTDDVFCAGNDMTNANACIGDSGGPVVIDGKLAGIVSQGYPCNALFSGAPGFHTRVHKHYDWIIKHTGLNFYRAYGTIVLTIHTGSSTKPTEGNYDADKVIFHEDYIPDSLKGTERNDICLIELSKPIEFNEFQQPIKIAQDPPKGGDRAITYGLGKQGKTRTETLVLKKMESDIMNQEDCRSKYMSYLQSDVFCLGEDGLTIPCSGDSGGPIVVDGKLAGVVSRGELCINRNSNTLSTHVRVHKHYDWIIKHTRIKY
ncbi:hypothetical protein TSAR_006708 [Trichomalopsis sarcophagae]|uniref:Peptidase S1 domain-containing protein n=1 Tax=Trichomalopsis sarcophagae TaxID=543379 RepID=A0A232EZW8_9HYME|nr:hypothetical protein TSAR_006708 [Trichomalopsis sarcophagae]